MKNILTPICAALLGSAVTLGYSAITNQNTPASVEAISVPAETSGYYAALDGNYIVIYHNGTDEPYKITDIDVRTLPDTDKKLLENKIHLENERAAEQLIEDYSS